jgi:drug/metabolite transporter (DMT)-like permease
VSAARWAPALLWVVPALWSSNHVVARAAPGIVEPHALAFGRWALALALMLPFVGPGLWRSRAAVAAEWRQLLVLGALGMWVCGAWMYIGGRTTTAANIALFYAATPVAIAVAGVALLGERMSRAQAVGIALAAAGVVFVIAKGNPANLLAVRLTAGDGWAIAAAVSWVGYSVLLRRWPSALGPGERLAATAAAGLLVMAPFTVAEWASAAWPPLGAKALGLIAVVAVLPGVLSYGAHALLQRELGAARTGLVMYLAPLYSVMLAWLLLGEAPGWYHAVGAALILPSIALATRRAPSAA